MPASTITVAQWVRRTIQWWRRTNGRAFCSLVTIGSFTLPRYGRTGRRVRGDEGILTNVQRLPRPPRPALACRPDDSTPTRSEEHTSELQSRLHLVCRLLLEKKKKKKIKNHTNKRIKNS